MANRPTVRLLGDVAKAAVWKRYALKKHALLKSLRSGYAWTWYDTPSSGVIIRILQDGARAFIRIFAGEESLLYEFITSDRVYVNVDSGGASPIVGGIPFVSGYPIIADAIGGFGVFDEGHVYKTDTAVRFAARSESIPGKAMVTAYSNQKVMGDQWYGQNASPLVFSNRSLVNRYARKPAASCFTKFNFFPVVNEHSITSERDFGINIPPTRFTRGEANRKGRTGMEPNPAGAFADPVATDFQNVHNDALGNMVTIARPKDGLEYAQTACLQNGRFIHVSAAAKKVYAFSSEYSFPDSPSESVFATIPYPAWADPDQPGINAYNDGVTFQFNKDGTRMCAILYKHEATFNGAVQRVKALNVTGAIGSPGKAAGTWDQIYDDPAYANFPFASYAGTYGVPLNKITPGFCEWKIDLQFDVSGAMTGVTVSLLNDNLGSDTTVDTYFIAADYHISSGKLVVAKLECWMEDGQLFPRHIGGTPKDPDNVDVYAHYEMALGYYTPPDALDPDPAKQKARFVEASPRVLVLRGQVDGTLIDAEINDVFRFYPSVTSTKLSDAFFKTSAISMDLRALAWAGRAEAFYLKPIGPGEDFDTQDEFRSFAFVHSYHGKKAKYKYAYTNGTANDKKPISQPEIEFTWPLAAKPNPSDPTSLPVPPTAHTHYALKFPMTKTSPFNHVTQSVLSLIFDHDDTPFASWSVHPKHKAVAFCTPVIYPVSGTVEFVEEGPYIVSHGNVVAMWLDVVDVGGRKTTHEKLYKRAYNFRQSHPIAPPESDIIPDRNWSFYHGNKLVMTFEEHDERLGDFADPFNPSDPNLYNYGSFRTAGIFFEASATNVTLLKVRGE